MSRLLPVRIAASPLTRAAAPFVERLVERVAGTDAERAFEAARAADLAPISAFAVPTADGSLGLVLVHEPARPDVRAAFTHPDTLALSTREWEVWSAGPQGAQVDATAPLLGEPLPTLQLDDELVRRHGLRRASHLYWSSGDPAALRALCARAVSPSRFPPLPGSDDPTAVAAASLGVVHATFAAEVAGDPGVALDPDAATPSHPQEPALDALLAPLLADLPAHADAEFDALLLLPGPLGTRHAWQLVAVVPDEAPLHRAALLRRRLTAHLGMLDRYGVAGALPSPPVVITRSALHGMLRRRLFLRPLRRLSIRLHGRVLRGDDVLLDGYAGADHTHQDLRQEAAALLDLTGRALRSELPVCAVQDLLFGAWPALLHLALGGSPLDPLEVAWTDLAGRSDGALSRVGSTAPGAAWGDPRCADRSRSDGFVKSWGPALVRLSEVTLEGLG